METLPPIVWAIPFFFATMGIEAALVRSRPGVRGYLGIDSAASLTMGVGNLLVMILTKGAILQAYLYLYDHARLFTLQTAAVPTVGSFLLLLVVEDFFYYWFHRLHHEVRLLWASHVPHHSSDHYNLSTALRQSWTTPFTGFVFWAPLPLLGFHPTWILVQQTVSLVYQYWIHTELLRRLGPLEWVLNTPSHHRVHHGRNPVYLDRNHGGILIVWDRLFGTFEPEREAVDFGITVPLGSFAPTTIAFAEWTATFRDAFRAPSVLESLRVLFGPPGYVPGGGGKTSADLRREALSTGSP